MCRAVTCRDCGKPDWAGCGAHVESVLGHVPKEQRCSCRESPKEKAAAAGGGFLSRLFSGRPRG
jgi:hypothetical protein